MKHITLYALFFVGLIYSSNFYGQDLDRTELEFKIDSLIPKDITDDTPGLVIGIVQNGELIFSKGYGLANIAYGIPNNPEMVYNIGSVSKQFLGYAFAMLHVSGDLNIDDPVSKYLEDWPEFEHKVKLRHLLTHTSGYREAYTISSLAGRIIGVDRLSKEECLEVVRKQPNLEFIPGSRWTYNSTAWVILAEILEKVTGKSADEWVESNIFNPLEMNRTQIESYVGEVIMNTAESYSFNKEEGYTNEKSNRAIFGAGDISANIPDLVKWINNFRTAKVGGKKVNEFYLEPFILNDKSNSKYALGIRVDSYKGIKRYSHNGSHEAFLTQLNYYPEHDLGIIAISNYGRTGWVSTEKITDLLLGEHLAPSKEKEYSTFEIKEENLENFSGRYLASTINDVINLEISDGSLTINGRTKLIPLSKTSFLVSGSESQFQFNDDSKEKIQLIITNGATQTYTKIESWNPNLVDLAKFEGDYWSEELETVYHTKVKDGKLTIEHRWLGTIILEPVTVDVFKADSGIYLKFTRSKANKISGFSVYSRRTLDVKFQRIK